MAQKKFYVVWKGRKAGVYATWDECKSQIDGFAGALYKSFLSRQEAENALKDKANLHLNNSQVKKDARQKSLIHSKPVHDSICVDAAWNTITGDMEYQGLYYKSNRIIFRKGPFRDGTNNIGEFLAIVHALGYCRQKKLNLPIYSDSRNAIKWVKDKKANTKLERTKSNEILFELIARAESWLKNNAWTNPILKWETEAWGENPADFGRK